jgi:DNA-directed RNA polymerase subunit RPC12/RpoP
MKHNLFVQYIYIYISTLICSRCGKYNIFNTLLHQHKAYSCENCGYTVTVKKTHQHKMIIDKRLCEPSSTSTTKYTELKM